MARRLFELLFALGLMFTAGAAALENRPAIGQLSAHEGNAQGASTFFSIQLFGCIMPLPPGYVLRADTWPSNSVHMYRLNPSGFIRIEPYSAPDQTAVTILSEVRIGTVTVLKIKGRKERFRDEPTAAFIHDGEVKIGLYGADEDWAEFMARECAENPAPK